MKHSFLKRVLWLLIPLLTLSIPNAWGDCNTYTLGWGTASGSNYTNFAETSGSVTNLLSFSTAQNGGTSAPAYNSNNSDLRLYYNSGGNGGSIKIIPVAGITITGFSMTTSTTPSVKYKVDGGTATSVSQSSKVYSVSGIAATDSLKIQNVNTLNTQLRIKTIQISYCYEPTSLANSSVGSTTATLSWIDTHDVNSYEVYRSTTNTAPAANATPTSTVTAKSVSWNDLTANTTYYWWVSST